MVIPRVFLVLLFFVATCFPAVAQLQGMVGYRNIVIERIPDRNRSIIDEIELEKVTLSALRNFVPTLRKGRKYHAWIYVNFHALRNGKRWSGNLRVEVRQQAMLIFNDSDYAKTPDENPDQVHSFSIWNTSTIFTGLVKGSHNQIRKELVSIVEKFAADYYQQNP